MNVGEGDIIRCVETWGPLVRGRLYYVTGEFMGDPIVTIHDSSGSYSTNLANTSVVEIVQRAGEGGDR